MRKVIINLCPTGMVPTKQMTPHVPIYVDEIIETVTNCVKLGVSVAHIHPRDKWGKPTWKPDYFEQIIGGIREKSDVLISATTSGRDWSEFEKRSAVLELDGDLKPELASLTVGSLNFIRQASVNDPSMISQLASKMKDRGIKPELEVFEPGMLHKAKQLIKKGTVSSKNPYFNMLFGSLGTSPLEPSTFATFHSMLPTNSVWSVAGIGKNYQLEANIIGLAFGGHIRIGLEDNIFFDKDKKELATNEMLVERIVEIMLKMGLEPATSDEAKEILGLDE